MSNKDVIITSNIKEIEKNNNNFDNIFMKKMKKIQNKHKISQLTHSNYFSNHSNNKIRLETSIKSTQMINKSTNNFNRGNISKNCKTIKKDNSFLDEEEIRTISKNSRKLKQNSPRENYSLKDKNYNLSGENKINKFSFIQTVISNHSSHNLKQKMKSENNSKTKSKSKNHNKNIMKVININVSKKPNPQMIIKYGNSKKVSTKSSKINIFNPYEQNKVEYKKLSRTAYHTKNNSRKNSTDKKRKNDNLHYHHNHFDEHSNNTSKNYSNHNNSKSLEFNNYLISNSKLKNEHHNSLGNSSFTFIKTKKKKN